MRRPQPWACRPSRHPFATPSTLCARSTRSQPSRNGGVLVLPATGATTAIQEVILQLTAQHRLPAIYTNRDDTAAGGLLSYAADTADMSRRAASYVDRILRGAKVSELPVQFP